MGKKCFICEADAKFKIKDTSDYYCEECAIENFGDVNVLVKVEDIAKKIKKLVDEQEKISKKAPQEEELGIE